MAQRKSLRKISLGNSLLKKISIALGAFFGLAVLSGLFLFFYYAKDLPRPEVFTERPFVLPTKIYDREGKVLLYQIYGEEKRTIVGLNDVPEYLKKAIIVTEDANFYRHFGLDAKGIVRAILNNFREGRPIYGGSTISQQLVRSSFLGGEKTIQRKIKEVILTLELERRYSKDQILEFYLNQVPFGANAYGAEAAAQTYFQKTASQVSLEEAALLASLIRAPSYLSPYGKNKEELLARKNYVLSRMAGAGFITKNETQTAQGKIIEFTKASQSIKAPHFAIYIKQYLEEKYPEYFLKEKGLKIYTTLDWQLQGAAEIFVKDGVKSNQKYNAYNAALVAINPKNGEVLAMVGSFDYWADPFPEDCSPGLNCLFEPDVNVAMFGKGRQPGSAFKPFAYAKAFEKGFSPETVLWDVKTEFNPDCPATADQEKDQYGLDCYHPNNYDEKFRGEVILRQALAQSLNVPSVKVLYLAGLSETINLAKKLGITTLREPSSFYGLSLVLGGGEVKLLDMVSAYGVFAARGLKTVPIFIKKIEDSQGNILEEYQKTQRNVLDPQVADLINNILSDNEARSPIFGSQSLLHIPSYEVAVKTGTTQEFRDAWAIGYTPNIVIGVWGGNNDATPIDKRPGAAIAIPIWNRLMRKALEVYPNEGFIQPVPVATDKPLFNKPELDPQYQNWQEAIQLWLQNQ